MPPHADVTCCHPLLLTRSQASHSTKQPRQHWQRVGAEDSLLAGCPRCTVTLAPRWSQEPALGSMCSAAGEHGATQCAWRGSWRY